MNTNTHYVYIYCDPRKKGIFQYDGIDFIFNYEPFYVGEGTGYRFRRHITNYEIEWNYNKIKNGKIEKILNDGFDLLKYVVFYKENISKEEASKIEISLIEKFGRLNKKTGILTNLTDGGEGVKGSISPNKGRTYEEIYGLDKAKELKKIKSDRLIGNSYGSNGKGKKHTEENKKYLSKLKQRKLKQLDKDFNLIKIWNYCHEAANELKISYSSIYNVLNPNMPGKSAAGFFWEYLDFENIKYKQIKNK